MDIDATTGPLSGAKEGGADAPAGGLWNRNFALLFQGQLVSQLGNQAFSIAMMYWLMEKTGSASLMGAVMMVSMLPGVVLGPIGGAIADRHDRVRLIVYSDALHGVLVLAFAALLFFAPGAVGAAVAALFAVALLGGLINAVFMPAVSAVIPDLVPRSQVAAANGLNQFAVQGAMLVGQALGGLLYRTFGAPLLFLIDGVSYLLSALSEAFIRAPRPVREEGPKTTAEVMAGYRRDTLEGIRFVWERRGMRDFLALAAALNFLVMPIVVLLPFFVDLRLGRGPEWYGFLLAALGAGSILGYVIAGGLPIGAGRRPGIVLGAFLGMAAAFGALGVVRAPFAALALFSAIGMLSGLVNIFLLTLFQLGTPEAMRGRVMGLVMTLSMAAAPLGMGLGGVLGDLTGKNVPLVYLSCASAMAVITLALAPRERLRAFLATDAAAPPAGAGHEGPINDQSSFL